MGADETKVNDLPLPSSGLLERATIRHKAVIRLPYRQREFFLRVIGREPMSKLILLIITEFCLLFALPGLAQDQPTATNSISSTQENEIRQYVLEEKRLSVSIPASLKLSVGVHLPPTVELFPFDPKMSVAQYRYTVIGGKTVVVNPRTRRVISIIE